MSKDRIIKRFYFNILSLNIPISAIMICREYNYPDFLWVWSDETYADDSTAENSIPFEDWLRY